LLFHVGVKLLSVAQEMLCSMKSAVSHSFPCWPWECVMHIYHSSDFTQVMRYSMHVAVMNLHVSCSCHNFLGRKDVIISSEIVLPVDVIIFLIFKALFHLLKQGMAYISELRCTPLLHLSYLHTFWLLYPLAIHTK
jgi:hypothetical protein